MIWCAVKQEYTYICQYAYWRRQVIKTKPTGHFYYDSNIEPSTMCLNNEQLKTARERVISDAVRASSEVRSSSEDRSSAAALHKESASVTEGQTGGTTSPG
jgi:hypothetical protein